MNAFEMGDIDIAWCPGCGNFPILKTLKETLAELQIDPKQLVMVSGIGQAAKIPHYLKCHFFNGLHGRALPPATAIKAVNPRLTVIAESGDGDMYGEGGNHFIHCIRRNPNITNIVHDNRVYGLTKGQASPTTEPDWDNKLTPGGTGIRAFHPLVIALASGANFVARAFSGDPNGTAETIAHAIRHPGFSFVEVLSPCVTFRPEQREWKNHVHRANVPETDDPARAARRIMTDDGFNLGVLYAGSRPPYVRPREARATVAQLEEEFAL